MTESITFPAMPDIRPVSKCCWLVDCDYTGPEIDGKQTTIAAGLKTDGGSIPRIVWPMIGHPFQIPGLAAFVLHDAEYMAELYTRRECDWRLLCGLKLLGIWWWKRNAIYLAVRLGGCVVWSAHHIADVSAAMGIVGIFSAQKKTIDTPPAV